MGLQAPGRGFFPIETLERRQLLAFGTPNADFGIDGVATRQVTGSGGNTSRDMLVLPSGGILAATGSGMVRFDADGNRVDTFGNNGVLTFPGVSFRAMASDGSSYVYVLGTSANGPVVSRYTLGGKVAAGYGGSATGNTARVNPVGGILATTLTVDRAGRVLVGGAETDGNGKNRAAKVVRLNAQGLLDANGFGGAGATTIRLGPSSVLYQNSEDAVAGIHVLNNGKILVAGGATASSPGFYDPQTRQFVEASVGDTVFAVAKLNANGTVDTAYGEDAVARSVYIPAGTPEVFDYNVQSMLPRASALMADGSVTLGGSFRNQLAVFARFDAVGDVAYQVTSDSPAINTPVDMVRLADGRVAALAAPGIDGRLSVATITTQGVLSNAVQGGVNNEGATTDAEIATTADGDVVVFGALPSASHVVSKLDAGAAGDPRPDEFLNARANDIVTDNKGRLHLAYYDAATTTLKYAMRDERGLWAATKVVDGSRDAGHYVAIDTDSKGNPGIAYFDGSQGDLKLALFNGVTWTLRTVESKGSVGLYPTLDFDDSDRPTMTYYRKTGGDLRFARFDPATAGFSYETVDSEGDVGRSSVLVASPKTRRYSIAYTSTTTGEVKWAGRKPGGVGWNIKTAATTAGGADFLSMAYGDHFEPAISYYDATTADLKVTYFDANAQKFIARTIATSGAVGLYSQISFANDSYGEPTVLAWHRTSDRIIRYRQPLLGNIEASTAVGGGGRYLSLDGTGSTVAYFDAAANKLKVRDLAR